ncbi:hypothetical protein KM043_001560 [Ampulex compressa]|nr:hypothetical protein KM043_001560 [Ampulex compressa]
MANVGQCDPRDEISLPKRNIPASCDAASPMDTGEDDGSEVEHYAYQEYLFEQREWPGYNESRNASRGSRIVLSKPFLLMELSRLIPYLENDRVQFHPLNVPDVKIGKIQIAAQVMEIWEDVEDGTGSLCVLYDKKRYDADLDMRKNIDAKYRHRGTMLGKKAAGGDGYEEGVAGPNRRGQSVRAYPKPRPGFDYPTGASPWAIAALEHDWWTETKKGTLGKRIAALDHVRATGYYMFDPPSNHKPNGELGFEELRLARTSFFAIRLQVIQETEYNGLLQTWIRTVVRDRYCARSARVTQPG